MVRPGQVQHVHDAQDFREGIRQEIGIDRFPALVRDLVPVSADGLIEALVEQGKPTDQGHGGGYQQGNADLLSVPLQIQRQHLALERVVDGLVTPFNLISFQVDEHVGQAGDGPHEQGGQAEQDPQGRQWPTCHSTDKKKTEDDRQEQRPRGPREQTFPEQEALPDAPSHDQAEAPQDPADQADLVQYAGCHHRHRQRSPAADTTFEFARVWRTRRTYP